MLVFGGYYTDDPDYTHHFFDDVWALSLATPPAWTVLVPNGTPPDPRAHHNAIYDPARDRMLVFGGVFYDSTEYYFNTEQHFNDVWALSLDGTPDWSALVPAGTPPSARSGQSATYDPVGDRIVVFGGEGDSAIFNDVWALSLAGTPAWTQLTPAGTPSPPRFDHGAIYDPSRNRMVVFGGNRDGGRVNDLWALWLGDVPLGVGEHVARPALDELRSPAPNPSRGTTTVNWSLAQAGRVQLGIYDVSGRLVRSLADGERPAGAGTAAWDGTDESGARQHAGVYFVRLTAPSLRETRRVVLLQ
jgi:hypothetical protein